MQRPFARSRRRRSPLLPALAILCATPLVARTGAADCSPPSFLSTCVDADAYRPHFGAGRFLTIGATETTAPGQAGFGLVTSYASRPIVLHGSTANQDGVQSFAIDDLVDTTFLWSFGIFDRLEIGAALEATLYRTGDGVNAFSSEQPAPISKTATRDARVGFAYAILPRARTFPGNPFALTARFELSLPTGDEQTFAGDRGYVGMPSLDADLRQGNFYAGIELGARIRQTTDLAGARVGSQLVAGLGLGYDLLPNELLSLQLEGFALPTLAEQQTVQRDPASRTLIESSGGNSLIPAEWLASIRSSPIRGGDFSLVLGGGGALPLTDGAITTPRYRFVLALRYAALERDSDGDGVPDRADQCPDAVEDRDGFEDDDGCPDPDNDKDGIPDTRDRCRDEPETVDGFQDEDGCPDLDDDKDGIPDEVDRCRMEPEDKDGFQDDDGCPDPDNDKDGIPDVDDRCPNAPEDRDGYQDQDGCPDPDNDLDQIPDAQDQCPNEAEDKDGFQDDDGCPDPDNDHDGIPDTADKCPNDPETIDGHDDADGCPEPNARSRVAWTGNNIAVSTPTRFAAGKSAVPAAMASEIAMIAQLARGRGPLGKLVVETYADRPGDNPANQKLAAARADAVRSAFLHAGIEAEHIAAAVGDLSAPRAATAPPFDVEVLPPSKR